MKIIIWILSLVVLLGIGLLGYHQYKVSHYKNPVHSITNNVPTVSVHTITPQHKIVQKTYVGYVKPINQVDVVSYIPGFVDQVLVQGGQEVKKNDPLFIINQDQYKANLDLADAKVQQAQAAYDNAKLYYDRMIDAGQRAISKTDLDNAKTQFLSATAALAEAKANRQLAQVNYNYTMINATIDGIIGDVPVTIGDYVSPEGGPLISIISYDPIRVLFSISNKEYLTEIVDSSDGLMKDWTVKLGLADGRVYDQIGQVKFLSNEISPSTSSISVFADFDNPSKQLVSNAYVDVILEKSVDNGIFIDHSHVHFVPGGAFVYTLNAQNMIEKTPVQTGISVGNQYWIKSGLMPGSRIITDTVGSYMMGHPVKIKGQ